MISYIGGKYRQAKWICSFIPAHVKRYVEVFGGAMWVYVRGDFDTDMAIYNDVNRFMANLFECCRNYNDFIPLLKSVEAQNESLFNEYKEEILQYYHGDKSFDLGDLDIGAKYAYIVTQCFSGIMSEKVKFVDLKGKYNSKYNSFCKRLENPTIQGRLDKIKAVTNVSYETLIPKVDREDTILYLDPPYYSTEKLYAFHDFGKEDHEKLQSILKTCKSKWILSYYEYPELNEWFPRDQYRWELKDFKKASMASQGKKQSIGTEVLVMNYGGSE